MPEAADILLAVLVRGKRIVRTGFKIKQPELRCEITLKILYPGQQAKQGQSAESASQKILRPKADCWSDWSSGSLAFLRIW